jgi:hypothetical protein
MDEANLITFDTKIKQQDNTNDAVYGKMQVLPEGLELTFNPANTRLFGRYLAISGRNRIYIKGNDILFTNVALSRETTEDSTQVFSPYSPDEIDANRQ